MSYINIDLDSLIREIGLLMQNNYRTPVHKNNFESLFFRAKKDILKTIDGIIEENKSEVKKEVLGQ